MFWRKRGTKEKKKKAVKKIEGRLRRHMVRQHGVGADILKDLRRVQSDAVLGDKPLGLTMIRIFHPAAAKEKGVVVKDYESLDSHPELILYEGYYENSTDGATNIRIEKSQQENPGLGGEL